MFLFSLKVLLLQEAQATQELKLIKFSLRVGLWLILLSTWGERRVGKSTWKLCCSLEPGVRRYLCRLVLWKDFHTGECPRLSPLRDAHFVHVLSIIIVILGPGTPPQPAWFSTADVRLPRLQRSLVVGPELIMIVSTGTNTLPDLDIFTRGSD